MKFIRDEETRKTIYNYNILSEQETSEQEVQLSDDIKFFRKQKENEHLLIKHLHVRGYHILQVKN